MIRVDAIEALPAAPGAYALLLALPRAVAAPERLDGAPLGPGLYVYAGSARGPGGIRARVARHARRGKPRHWHVDRLTEVGRIAAAVAIPDGRECAVVETLRTRPGVGFPVPGFGASDCRACPAHLLRVPDPFGAEDLARGMPPSVLYACGERRGA